MVSLLNLSGSALMDRFVTKQNAHLSFASATINALTTDGTKAVQSVTSDVQGLTYTYSSSDTSVASISGTTITIVGVGTATITASFAGNETYNPASASYSLVVAAATTDNVITYKASAKLSDAHGNTSAGLHVDAFNTSINSHVFANGVGTITFDADVTSIGQYAFYCCYDMTEIDIPNSVTSIGIYAFNNCSGLTSITIPSAVTKIGNNGMRGCSALNKITCKATTAPSISSGTFRSVKTGGTLYVPTGSTGYNTWMGTENYYLGRYSWTKVEQ